MHAHVRAYVLTLRYSTINNTPQVRMLGPNCGRTYILGAPSAAAQERWAAALRRAADAWRTARVRA